MYLKKIEAQGFKSFANKTILEFDPGIMGIVGPNGSGKSNVVDAVRWVLGEQSAKQLRGSNMQDVIFSGTESRKPQGYAYVTLTLDNADHALPSTFDEVIVTRRVYRSGESEYLLNGNPCRLRDINELFYDTGVGKEGYSIISQGQIDKILSTKPEDRRELFDEAAGIVKYKKRKDISLKKLQEEQNNLLRVTDVLNELEKQVGPLHKQAETAKEYLKLRDELKVYEVGMFYRESQELREKLDSVNEKLAITQNDFEEASKKSQVLRDEFESSTKKKEALDKQIESDKEALSGLNIEKENLDGQIKVIDEQALSLKAAEEELRKRLAALDEKRAGIAKSKEVYLQEKGELNDKLDEADDIVSKTEEEIKEQEDTIRIKEKNLELKQSGLLDDLKNQADISGGLSGIAAQLENANEQKDMLIATLEAIEKSIAENKKARDDTSSKLESISKNIRNLEKKLSESVIRSSDLEHELQKTETELAFKISEYNVANSKLEAIKNMAERYDGYGESIKHIMNAKKTNSSIVGVVADIIRVDKKYEVAIETALGGHIQNVVTKDEATAKHMVEYLKKERLGRVTFLPMDAVKGSDVVDRNALSEKGVIDTANNLVHFDSQYQGIVDRLLGRIIVVDNINNALIVAKNYKYKLHIVTLEGEYLAPGGSITGGAFKNNSNLLSRKREMEALEKEITELKTYGEKLKSDRDKTSSELASIKDTIDSTTKELSENKVEEATLKTMLDSIISEQNRLEGEKVEKQNEQKDLLLLITDLTSKVNDTNLAKKEAEEAEQRRKDEAAAMIKDIENEREKLKELNDLLSELKLEFSKLSERDNFLVENLDRINEELESIDEEKLELLKASDPEGLRSLAKQREKDKLVKKVEELTKTISELVTQIDNAAFARDEFSKKMKELLEDKDNSLARYADLDKEILRLNNSKERITEQIENKAAYLWNEYEMTPIEAESHQYDGEESISEIKKLISDHKAQIKELGPVNINAIDEEKEVGERYEFLSAQHEDLVKARDSILEIIADLEKGMREQFEEKFALIKEEFDKVFKELFGGGKGTIDLLAQDNGDILEAGISIIAQPPGKKLQNMMQLSGGEKALTAIALIFAIQNLKPSPFCLLDEIEAALDETNVARFASYLEKLKSTTQLITITHRRGTMEAAEKLYGITMQEKGISTVVSVNFTDAAKYGEENV